MHDRTSERIEYISPDDSGKEPFFDLSATGVCFHYGKKVEKDAVLRVKINELTVTSKVVYCQDRTDGFRIGLQFVQVPPDQQKTLNDCVEKFSRGVAISCAIVEKS